MKLPKSWTTVTPLSKLIALLILVLLPFLAFWLGYHFGELSRLPEWPR